MDKYLLKYIRQLSNLSQSELAEMIDVSQGAIAHMESGHMPISSDKERDLYNAFQSIGIGREDIEILNTFQLAGKRLVNRVHKGETVNDKDE